MRAVVGVDSGTVVGREPPPSVRGNWVRLVGMGVVIGAIGGVWMTGAGGMVFVATSWAFGRANFFPLLYIFIWGGQKTTFGRVGGGIFRKLVKLVGGRWGGCFIECFKAAIFCLSLVRDVCDYGESEDDVQDR